MFVIVLYQNGKLINFLRVQNGPRIDLMMYPTEEQAVTFCNQLNSDKTSRFREYIAKYLKSNEKD